MPTPAPEEASEAFDEWSEPEPEPEPVPLSALEPEPAPKPKAVPPPAALTRARRTDSDTAPEQEWSETLVQQKATDPEALTEVDNLIATGELTKARQLLTELTKGNQDNPEYHVRLLHVESALGDSAKASEQEQILAKMSEGVLSDTRSRIKEIGRGLLPGHPLFDDDKKREEARRIMEFHGSDQPAVGETNAPEQRKPVAAPDQRPQAPPLILDLEVDDETIDFFNDISFGSEDGTEKKG